jgi:hypothetical protein
MWQLLLFTQVDWQKLNLPPSSFSGSQTKAPSVRRSDGDKLSAKSQLLFLLFIAADHCSKEKVGGAGVGWLGLWGNCCCLQEDIEAAYIVT